MADPPAVQWIIDIPQSYPLMPRIVGPFPTREAASAWWTANASYNAHFQIRPITSPEDYRK